MKSRSLACWMCWVLAACGSDNTTFIPGEIDVRAAVPAEATAASTETVELGARVGAIGISAAGGLIAAAGGQIFELHAGSPELRQLYAEANDPTELGDVHTIAPKNGGGSWIAAAEGLFELDPLYVTKVRIDTGAVLSAGEVMQGELAGLWLATTGGLQRRAGEMVHSFSITNLEGVPSDIAVEPAGKSALVLSGDELALVEVEAGKILSDRPPLDAGAIHAIAAGSGVLFAGSDGGLLRFDPRTTPKWTRFTLTASTDSAEAVRSLAVDPVNGVAWARTDSSLVSLDGDTLTRFALSAAGASPASIAVDQAGDVWTIRGEAVEKISPTAETAAVTYAADVRPWISAHCSACHMNQTQNFEDYAVFAEKAELALSRVRSGDMPRCTGGLPCAPEQRLAPSEYAVLEKWIRAGKPE